MVETGKVTGRRAVRYQKIAEAQADLDALAVAEQRGKLKQLGNWSLGQACGHIETWLLFAYNGTPPEANPPWFIKLILRTLRSRLFGEKGMPAGVRIPGIKGGTLGTEPLPTEVGVARLKTALTRLESEAPAQPHVVFGPLTHEDWKRLHLNHAALHLSFFAVE